MSDFPPRRRPHEWSDLSANPMDGHGQLPPEICAAFNSAWHCAGTGSSLHELLSGTNPLPMKQRRDALAVFTQLVRGLPLYRWAISAVCSRLTATRKEPARVGRFSDINAHILALGIAADVCGVLFLATGVGVNCWCDDLDAKEIPTALEAQAVERFREWRPATDMLSHNEFHELRCMLRIEADQAALTMPKTMPATPATWVDVQTTSELVEWRSVQTSLEEILALGKASLARDNLIKRLCSEHGVTREQAESMMVGTLAGALTARKESGESPATSKRAAEEDKPNLPPAREKAYRQWQAAMRDNAALNGASDQDVYDWLTENSKDDEPLPVYSTWTRYLREARQALGTQKHKPRSGRKTGRSIVRPDQI